MFLGDAKEALAQELAAGETGKYTREELLALETTLKEHETWLNDAVEAQKRVKMNEDPAVESAELYRRAKVLETHLQKLVKKKAPKKKTSTTSTATSTATSSAETPTSSGHDEL